MWRHIRQYRIIMTNNFFENFSSRTELIEKYGDNALLLVAAEMRMGIEDLDSFALEYLTDGSNDKKCDLVCLNLEKDKLIIAQGYFTKKNSDKAPANKATDLIAATRWLLNGNLSEEQNKVLYNIAQEVRELLKQKAIKEVEIWYVHNLPESESCFVEIKQAADNAKDILAAQYDININVKPIEIGKKTLENDYNRLNTSIYVSSDHIFDIDGGFELQQNSWKTFVTAISFEDIVKIWNEYGTDLLSPNIRDYLGIVQRETNINNKISETISNESENFVVYNNGITILVNDYSIDSARSALNISGIGIVNGGQTTGTIGESKGKNGKVIARFIKSNDKNLLEKIVRYNNTQNNVKPADFRSSDPTQKRLTASFNEIYGDNIIYSGARRGGPVRRSSAEKKKTLVDTAVAQGLAAFHQEPNIAYNKTKLIWEDDSVYVKYFNNETTPGHILFTYSLLKSIEEYKKSLKDKENPTSADSKKIEYFSMRGSHIMLATAISNSIESIIQSGITDKYSLEFNESIDSIDKAVKIWEPIVSSCASFANKTLSPVTGTKMGNHENVEQCLEDFLSNIDSLASTDAFENLGNSLRDSLKNW